MPVLTQGAIVLVRGPCVGGFFVVGVNKELTWTAVAAQHVERPCCEPEGHGYWFDAILANFLLATVARYEILSRCCATLAVGSPVIWDPKTTV